MRVATLSFLAFFLPACGGGDDGGDGGSAVDDSGMTEALAPLGDACVLDPSELTAILGWTGGDGPFPNQFNSDLLSACDYVGAGTSGRLEVVFTRYEDDIIEQGFLEATFDDNLAGNGTVLSWQAVPDAFGDETIYGVGIDGPNNVYHLLIREGNHTQLGLRHLGSEARDAESTLDALLLIAEDL